jgi:hypothetical protein
MLFFITFQLTNCNILNDLSIIDNNGKKISKYL